MKTCRKYYLTLWKMLLKRKFVKCVYYFQRFRIKLRQNKCGHKICSRRSFGITYTNFFAHSLGTQNRLAALFANILYSLTSYYTRVQFNFEYVFNSCINCSTHVFLFFNKICNIYLLRSRYHVLSTTFLIRLW